MDYKIRKIRVGLKTLPISEYSITDSTNTRARLLAKESCSDALVVANGQSKGRGRLGRKFSSEEGKGIYMSLLLHPKTNKDALALTALMGVAVCRAVESLAGVFPKIKWLNDIQLGEKKLAGILAEGEFDKNGNLKYTVIGVGLNILKRDFGELSEIATALEEHTLPPAADKLLSKITREFYKIYMKKNHEKELRYYREHSSVIGENITVSRGGESFSAKAIDIDCDFSLIIDSGGSVHRLSSAEVTVRKL